MKRSHAIAGLSAAVIAVALLYACSGDDTSNNGTTNPGIDSGGPITQADGNVIPAKDSGITPQNDANPSTPDAGPDGDCFQGTPTTYLEIINACTNALAIDKTVDLSSMNLADGGLQPLH